jgi:hypothetical protein
VARTEHGENGRNVGKDNDAAEEVEDSKGSAGAGN